MSQVDDYDFDNENDVSAFCPSAGADADGDYPLDIEQNKSVNQGKHYFVRLDHKERMQAKFITKS